MSDAAMIHALMIGLVERAGGPENAARMIDAVMGYPLDGDSQSTRKGTISRRVSGSLKWPLDEIMALEDATVDFRVREWLAQRAPGVASNASLIQLAADVSRETGEAISAVLALASGRGSRGSARKEHAEAYSFMRRLGAELEGAAVRDQRGATE